MVDCDVLLFFNKLDKRLIFNRKEANEKVLQNLDKANSDMPFDAIANICLYS